MSDIFISYASGDRPIAQKFASALETFGWSVWWDREIPVGKNFDQVIEEELNAAGAVVVLWSQKSVSSRWVKTESSAAADRDRLIPALIDDATIPLEFKRIETAMLPNWNGDTAASEFQKLVAAVRALVGRSEATGRAAQHRQDDSETARAPWFSTRLLSASAVLLIVIVGLIFAKKVPWDSRSETNSPAPSDKAKNINPPSQAKTVSSTPPMASDSQKSAPPKGAFLIRIGDEIEEGIPGPGAGSIETPYAHDVYSFMAAAGQRVYFRMLHHSNGLSSIPWRLTDADGMEVFKTCLGCTDPGVQTLTKGGAYSLTVGSDKDPATGTYQVRLFNVPPPNRFSIKIGDQIKENTPGPGAGAIESPGAENIYIFTAAPKQSVYFRMYEHSSGMGSIKWKVVDDNGMEVFNTCLGCTESGVQTLTKGGTYTLTVGNRIDPTTGTYRLQLFNVPPPNQFAIKIGDKIKPGMPGAGAGMIEIPGAEDIYVFSAAPGQKVYFRMLDHDKGMNSIKWRLIDENSAEVFNTCLGCSDPGVQTLTRGGRYTLIVGNHTDPATGNYAFETGSR
jgi:hypothetical protein